MIENNPMKDPEVVQKVKATCDELYGGIGALTTKRNLENHPLSNPESRKKLSKTRKRRIADGRIDLSYALEKAKQATLDKIAKGEHHWQT